MSDFRFEDINWLHAAWAVLVCVAALVAWEVRGRKLLDRMISPWMQSRLVVQTSLPRRLLGIALFGCSLLGLVVALMRPQWGMTVQQLTRVDSQIMICLDVSKSMLAEDVVPNRLERAKAEIDVLLGFMDEGQQVGLTAFAGKATVMCPMTTDFGFLRLILQEVQPSTVGLGGTRIGDAIRKAVSGFRETGDVNRLVLLITDGEDHDSFPLDAAEDAKQKGVRIVSVGFGDEAGSKIEITDPATGARTYVKDRNGVDVISRLDGGLLRDMALKTDGAYIPAGTGALDLQSIYDSHIKTMLAGTQTQEERVIRNEAYQWCVLAALVLLVTSLLVPQAFGVSRRRFDVGESVRRSTAAAFLFLASWVMTDGTSFAQDVSPTQLGEAIASSSIGAADSEQDVAGQNPDQSTAVTSDAERLELDAEDGRDQVNGGDEVNGDASDLESEAELPPRQIYNQALRFISRDLDRAERMLNDARGRAGVDGELRYRVLYNLGWVEVNRADSLIQSEPEEALQRLELAASRFREAIRVRPDSQEARHNLEVISKRILALRDSLAKRDPQDFAQRLDALIQAQRNQQSELQSQISQRDVMDPNDVDLRSLFRRLGVSQRQILSDAQKLTEDAAQQIDALKPEQDDEPSPQKQLQRAQLTNMLRYLDLSVQRMGKARSFTRRLQSQRAFVRWSAALSSSKRARDQLRDPVEVLGVLIGDATELARLTREVADSRQPLPVAPQTPVPAWLTLDYLLESQKEISERTEELQAILSSAAKEESVSGLQPPEDKPAADLRGKVRNALPLLEQATSEFRQAEQQLQIEHPQSAASAQSAAITALLEAAEQFFDLRRLIETVYRDEVLIKSLFEQLSTSSSADTAGLQDSLRSAAEELQAKNLSRCARLDEMLTNQLDEVEQRLNSNVTSQDATTGESTSGLSGGSPEPGAASPPSSASPEELQLQKQRLELAKQLLLTAESQMADVERILNEATETFTSEKNGTPLAAASPAQKDVQADPSSASEASQYAAADNDTNIDTDTGRSADTGAGTGTNTDSGTQEAGDPQPVEGTIAEESSVNLASPTAEELVERDDYSLATTSVDAAVETLEELRRLFFSVIEHLRETAQRQAELNDKVVEHAGGQGSEPIGALASRQAGLQKIASEIAKALEQQAAQIPKVEDPSASGGSPTAPPSSSQDTAALAEAADLVEEGSQFMQSAVESLDKLAPSALASPGSPENSLTENSLTETEEAGVEDVVDSAIVSEKDQVSEGESGNRNLDEIQPGDSRDPVDQNGQNNSPAEAEFGPALELQQEALKKLLEALALLDQRQSGNQQNQPQNQSSQQQDQSQQSSPDQSSASESSSMNANEMLQAIRDREAQRRREKNKPERSSSGSVEKDW